MFALLVFNEERQRNEEREINTFNMLNSQSSVTNLPKAEQCVATPRTTNLCVHNTQRERIYAKMNCKYRGK